MRAKFLADANFDLVILAAAKRRCEFCQEDIMKQG
jgi:hypothetical protein